MKNLKIVTIGLGLITAAFFYSCSKDSSSSDVSIDDDGGNVMTAIAPAALVGTWGAVCVVEGTGAAMHTVVVEDGLVTRTDSYFGDSACTSLDKIEVYTNSVLYGSEYNLPIGGEAVYNIDGTSGTFSITPQNTVVADDFNTAPLLCGFNDWSDGITKVLTVDNCIGDDLTNLTEVLADWYQIAGVVSTKLYIGDTETDPDYDGTTAAKRPIALEATGI